MRVARIARSRQPSVVTGPWVRFPVLGAAVLSATVMVGHATEFPARPLRLVVPYPAGGNGDVVARILAADMAKGLGQHLVVETRPGAGGTIGADVVAKAAPDGHTLLLVTGGHAVAAASYKSLPYRTVDSFSMVSTATFFPFVVVVRADGGYPSLPALLQAAKAAPGIVKFGSAGPGVTQHLTGELLSKMAGARFLYVPYKGDAPAVTALLGSEINLIITPTAPVLRHVQAHRDDRRDALEGHARSAHGRGKRGLRLRRFVVDRACDHCRHAPQRRRASARGDATHSPDGRGLGPARADRRRAPGQHSR